MRNLIISVALAAATLLATCSPVHAQEAPPQWAIDLKAQLDRIETKLDSGVKLATEQGQVKFTCDLDHQACFTVRNTRAGGYGMYVRGEAVGLVAEGLVGQWDIGDVGFVAEGNKWYGLQAVGQSAGLFANAWSGYGIQAKGALGPVSPSWSKVGAK